MPSSNVRDDLPSYYDRVQLLRQVAAAVIRSMPRRARRPDGAAALSAQARPSSPLARPKADASSRTGRTSQPTPQALPRSLSSSNPEAYLRGQDFRDRLLCDPNRHVAADPIPVHERINAVTTKHLFAKLVVVTITALALVVPVSSNEAYAADCTFVAPVPYKSNGNIKATASISGCSASLVWYLTLQRHRYLSWWQNEANNWRQSDGTVTVIGGCVPGTWTYRTVLTSSAGHQSVSGHARITC